MNKRKILVVGWIGHIDVGRTTLAHTVAKRIAQELDTAVVTAQQVKHEAESHSFPTSELLVITRLPDFEEPIMHINRGVIPPNHYKSKKWKR